MTRFLLDTNIVSQLAKPRRSPTLIDWWSRQNDDDLHISAQTLGEIWRGLLIMPQSARKEALISWFQGATGPAALFAGRVLPHDGASALRWAEVLARERAVGRTRDPSDMIIAATALVNDCVLVTDNARDFEGVVEVINPVRGAVS